ncbi:MAG: LCP family protein [Micropruina sp.]|nr:LCP family protein [Micropruina sp.]
MDAGQHVHLDGDLTLRFVRTRVQSTDYSRMIRQKCVMSAMLKQLSPTNVLSKFQEIVQAGKDIVETDVPSSQIGTLIDLASKAKNLPIASTAISPPLVPDTVNPDWAKIKVIVADSITASQKLDQADASSAAATPTTSATPSKASTAKPSTAKASASASTKTTKATATATSSAYQAGQTDNLDQVCGVS